jgi:hypothetical protein
MRKQDLRDLIVMDSLVCPGCRRAVRVLLGDDQGRLFCTFCFGRHARGIPV